MRRPGSCCGYSNDTLLPHPRPAPVKVMITEGVEPHALQVVVPLVLGVPVVEGGLIGVATKMDGRKCRGSFTDMEVCIPCDPRLSYTVV